MKRCLAAVAAISTLTASAAWAAPSADSPLATYTLEISGFVPMICRAELNSSQVASQAGEIPLGQMSEFCNNDNGYEVWVDYSPNLAGDTLVVDGQQILLTASGSARIDNSDRPNIAIKSVALDVPTNGVSGTLSVRVVSL